MSLLRRLRWWSHPSLSHEIIVNMCDQDTAVRGVLNQVRGEWLVLSSAAALTAGREPARIDGTVVIKCSRVAFIQQLPPD